jgi:hypothetical protein
MMLSLDFLDGNAAYPVLIIPSILADKDYV